MVKLKTLKDFRNLKILLRCTENVAIKKRWFKEGNVGCCMQLKQEAIKWVKFFDKERAEQEKYRKKTLLSAVKGNYEVARVGGIELFKHFFNLTEEDLSDV